MSGFFSEFKGYSNFGSGGFSQAFQQGGDTSGIVMGRSKQVNVIQQAEQQARAQIDVLASAARGTPPSGRSTTSTAAAVAPRMRPASAGTAPKQVTSAPSASVPATPATAATASTPTSAGSPATTVIVSTTTTTTTSPVDAGAGLPGSQPTPKNKDEPDYSSFAPPGGDDDPAEIARLLAEEAKFLEQK